VNVPFSPTLAILSPLLFLIDIYGSHDQQEEDPSPDLQYQHQLILEPSRGGFTSALPNAIHMRQWWFGGGFGHSLDSMREKGGGGGGGGKPPLIFFVFFISFPFFSFFFFF
jgi:hypothetical protein